MKMDKSERFTGVDDRVVFQGVLITAVMLEIFLVLGIPTPYWEISTLKNTSYGLWQTCNSVSESMARCQSYTQVYQSKMADSEFLAVVLVLELLGLFCVLVVIVTAIVALCNRCSDGRHLCYQIIVIVLCFITAAVVITGTVIWRETCVPLLVDQVVPSFSFFLCLISGLGALVVGCLLIINVVMRTRKSTDDTKSNDVRCQL